MSQPSADAKAVVRAAEALTMQVRRIADALSTPVVEGVASGSGDCGCYNLGPREPGHTRCELGHTLPPARETDDGPTTPATTCSAQYTGHASGARDCIRAGQHHGDHIDEQGYHWSDTVAVYPTDSTVRVAHWHPVAEQLAEERQELASMVGEFVDAQVQHARAAEDRLPCPYCTDRQMMPRPQLVEHIAQLHPEVETAGVDAACREMETRTCPATYNGPCGDRPCARFESDDPAPWLDPAEPPYVGATTTPKAAPADDEEAQRTARRDSLRNLLDRLDRSTVHHYDEAQLLRQHVETEIREADTARAVAAGNKRHVQALVPELTAAQDAIGRVRAEVRTMAQELHVAEDDGMRAAINRVLAALDGTEPSTEASEPAT